MTNNSFVLKGEDRIVHALRALYGSYGYIDFKMSRFEEYDLYGRNKDFLVSGSIITFTDTDGSLMALKPDVTLSIVKGFREEEGCVSKLSYDEKVYRVSSFSKAFKEITQVGIECLGDIDSIDIGEVALLAQKSIKLISDDSMLTISHMGITEAYLDRISSSKVRMEALSYMEKKNISLLDKLIVENPENRDALSALRSLLFLSGSNDEIIRELYKMGADQASVRELEEVISVLDDKSLRIDFSVLGEMNYYNGITFRGYVKGVPESVVSGGEYDKLMARMGKKAKAIGFAVYMDVLEKFLEESEEYSVDVALVYNEDCPMRQVMEKAEEIRKEGKSVSLMKKISKKTKSREVVYLKGENNA